MNQNNHPTMDRIFFSHIPKNGGMAIRYFLRNQFESHNLCPYDEPQALMTAKDLSQFQLFQGHLHYDFVQMLPPVNVISFFREPIARSLSLLLHLRRDPRFHYLHERAKDKSISDMLNDEEITCQIANQQTAYIGGNIQFSKLKHDIELNMGCLDIGNYLTEPSLRLGQNRLKALSFVGLTENMGESLNRLCQQYGFHPCLDYAKRNQTQASDKQLIENLSTRDRKKIKALNRLDIELYDAAQSLFYERPEAFSYDQLVFDSLQKRELKRNEDNSLHLGDGLQGSNWYEAESSACGAAYRWSGPGQKSSLELPLWVENCELIQIEVHPLPGDDISSTLKLCLNGEPTAPPYKSQNGSFVVFELDVVATAVSLERGFHQLIFLHELDAAQLPQNGDARTLHFCLTAVRIIGGNKQKVIDELEEKPTVTQNNDGVDLLARQSKLISELTDKMVELRLAQHEDRERLLALQLAFDQLSKRDSQGVVSE